MTRPARPRAAVAALLLLVAGACERDAPPPAGPSAPPNILVYVVDTLRADALPAYGNTVVETPTIDALAADGVLYPEARSVSSWTRASVASMLTGLYPEAHGVETRADAVAPELTLLPELLSGRGYTTAAILTNPNLGSFYGFDQGFDTFVELYDRSEAGPVSHDEPMETADVTTDRAIAFGIGFGLSQGARSLVYATLYAELFGRTHLGAIQGGMRMVIVIASALGPAMLATGQALVGGYAPILHALAGLPLLLLVVAAVMPEPRP